jgi:hypothetical protein
MRKEGGVELRLFHPPPSPVRWKKEGGFHYIFSFIFKRACVGGTGEGGNIPKVFVNARVDLCVCVCVCLSTLKLLIPPPPLVCCN